MIPTLLLVGVVLGLVLAGRGANRGVAAAFVAVVAMWAIGIGLANDVQTGIAAAGLAAANTAVGAAAGLGFAAATRSTSARAPR